MSEATGATASDVVSGHDLGGRTAVVTGASSGLGVETARALAGAGAHVILAVRDGQAGRAAAASIVDTQPEASVEVAYLDLARLGTVRAFADSLVAAARRVDMLVNNAGVMGTPFSRTADGFEMQIGVNHLGHFALSTALLDLLSEADGARVVNVSSAGHRMSDIIWEDPNYLSRPYDKWEAYGQSKTANILFGVALDRRLATRGGHAYSVHPGMVDTRLSRYLEKGDFRALMERGRREGDAATGTPSAPLRVKSPAEGAATTVWALVAPLQSQGGSYLDECSVAEPAAYAADPEAAERLWDLSEELVA